MVGVCSISRSKFLFFPTKTVSFFSRRFGVGRAVQTLQFVRPIKRIRSGGTTIVAVPRQRVPRSAMRWHYQPLLYAAARRSVIFLKNEEFDPRFTSHSQSKSLCREPDEGERGTVRRRYEHVSERGNGKLAKNAPPTSEQIDQKRRDWTCQLDACLGAPTFYASITRIGNKDQIEP